MPVFVLRPSSFVLRLFVRARLTRCVADGIISTPQTKPQGTQTMACVAP